MSISRRQLEQLGEPIGDSATYKRPGDCKVVFGGGGGDDSTTRTEIPTELKPLAAAYTQKALGVGDQAFKPYTGQRYADMNTQQQQALGMIENRATQGDPTMNMATQQLQQTIQGQQNPFLDAMVNKAQANVLGNANAAAARSGSFGNSGIAQAAAKQMGDVATSMYGGAYESDRGRQMQALGMAPQFSQTAYNDASQLLQAGQLRQNQNQQNLDFAYQQNQEAQNLPYKQLAAMSAPFSSGLGQTQTTSGGGK